jgi:PHD/YefM family antitoxin component YafN of YafNO toxin-antitoxin module
MTLIPNINSLTDFQRNTSGHIRRLKKSGLPEVLTVNGRAELVVQTAESYQALLTRLELYESAAAITRGLQDHRDGRSISLEGFDAKMRAKIGARSKRPQ